MGFLKVVRPLNAVDIHQVPKGRVGGGGGGGGGSTRGGRSPSRQGGGGGFGISPIKNL